MTMTTIEAIKPDFRVFKTETTRYWRKDIRRKAGKLFAVYLFDANRHVHACELTPSYEMHYVGPTWTNSVGDRMSETIREGDADTDLVSYYHVRGIDAAKLEARSMTDEAWAKLLDYHDGDHDAAYAEALETEMEHLRCNGWIN
jgi:hypothetical protein